MSILILHSLYLQHNNYVVILTPKRTGVLITLPDLVVVVGVNDDVGSRSDEPVGNSTKAGFKRSIEIFCSLPLTSMAKYFALLLNTLNGPSYGHISE